MEKVGIITFHKAFNYGAILQAYALQKEISSLGFECEIVDVTDPVQSSKKISFKRKLILFIRSLLYFDRTIGYSHRCRKINKFVKNNFVLSKEKYNGNNISNSNSYYRVFVVGSDQVWNLSFKNNHIYLLDFVKKGNFKMSYAASFGYSIIPDKFIDHSKNSISTFDAISLRENSGIQILRDQIKRDDGVLVVDPTLLLNKEKWINMVNLKKARKVIADGERFVLYYAVAPQKNLLNLAIKTAQEKNIKLVILNNSTEIKVKSAINFYSAGIEDFIYLFDRASYVFTTSFHGLAFSINFNKQFIFETSSEKNNANDRLVSLTKELSLEDRNIDVLKNVDEPIDWKLANINLDNLRNRSMSYLNINLSKFSH